MAYQPNEQSVVTKSDLVAAETVAPLLVQLVPSHQNRTLVEPNRPPLPCIEVLPC